MILVWIIDDHFRFYWDDWSKLLVPTSSHYYHSRVEKSDPWVFEQFLWLSYDLHLWIVKSIVALKSYFTAKRSITEHILSHPILTWSSNPWSLILTITNQYNLVAQLIPHYSWLYSTQHFVAQFLPNTYHRDLWVPHTFWRPSQTFLELLFFV